MVIRAIDDFLIYRVVQRISDALARWVSCYGIAAFLRREERRAQDLLPVANYVEAFLALVRLSSVSKRNCDGPRPTATSARRGGSHVASPRRLCGPSTIGGVCPLQHGPCDATSVEPLPRPLAGCGEPAVGHPWRHSPGDSHASSLSN